MRVVITYGTFDILHIGHLNLLHRARALGDKLIVGISTDAFNDLKQKKSVQNFENRKAVVEAIRYVDFVFPEESWEQKVEDIRRFSADIFVMGSDWAGQFDFLQDHCRVVYLDRTDGISTTGLKESFSRHLDSISINS